MPTITIQMDQLAAAMRQEGADVRAAVREGSRRAANRMRTKLILDTNNAGIVDTGAMSRAWRVELRGADLVIVNDSPYAGVIEAGCRPHPVSKAGRDNIAAWAIRKLGVPPAQAKGVAFLIARKISRVGQQGHWIMRNALPWLRQVLGEEIVRQLNNRPKNRIPKATARRGRR